MPTLCRDCFWTEAGDQPAPARCPVCRSPRLIAHPELFDLSIAHMDCDAFFAAVEKRDNPDLRDKPVIVGGGKRGVVSTACYIARMSGVRSAMPMFQALKRCPHAVVVRPRMQAYVEASRAIRMMMEALTPVIEPLSLDEAFLDLTGTARLHGAPPALLLAKLTKAMETELGLSGSIGLSHNKFLAKLASDLDKPRGFAVIGNAETTERLADMPVSRIWGAGPVTQRKLAEAGLTSFRDLQNADTKWLVERFGEFGLRLADLAHGRDRRKVGGRQGVKSISNETTFFADSGDVALLSGHLWRLAEQVSSRAKAKSLAGRVITLKLKTAQHKTLTRRVSLSAPTQLADTMFRRAEPLLQAALPSGPFRLIGIGLSELVAEDEAGQEADLFAAGEDARRAKLEGAADAIRARFGQAAITFGRGLK